MLAESPLGDRYQSGADEPILSGEQADILDEGLLPVEPLITTVTLAELYLRQGHLRLAERVLEKILRQEPRNEKATELLREVRDRLQPEGSVQRQAAVKAELSRWLDNIARMRGHAT